MKTKATLTKIGNSQGVRISKKYLQDLNLEVGDDVEVQITPVQKNLDEFSKELDGFFDTHEEDLKSLAQR